MNKLLTILSAVLLGTVTMSARAPLTRFSFDPDRIIITGNNEDPSLRPRMPSTIQIEAYYYASLSSVAIILHDAGEYVSVSIENASTGEYYNYEIPGTGGAFLPISSSEGFWQLSIVLETGEEFYGSFMQ